MIKASTNLSNDNYDFQVHVPKSNNILTLNPHHHHHHHIHKDPTNNLHSFWKYILWESKAF